MIKGISALALALLNAAVAQTGPEDWQKAGFNDDAWESVRELGGLGMAPWTGALTTEGPAAGLPASAKWIWHPPIAYSNSPIPADTWWFRKEFVLPGDKSVLSAKLIITADNIFTAHLNGNELGTSDDWQTFSALDARSALVADTNVIAISVENTIPGPAGLIGALVIRFTDGSSLEIPTGSGWKMILPAHPPELLWPAGAPGAKGTADADRPSIIPYLPDPSLATGVAVIICPGGGYTELSMDVEGSQMGAWYNKLGIAAFVVKSRLAPYRHPYPLMDAKRAMKWVRSNWKRFNLDTTRIGIHGTSAGGHLASTLAVHADAGDKAAKDPIDRWKSKGDFQVIGYPVITMEEPLTHMGSRNALLGPNPSKVMIDSLSTHKHVTPKTPITFLFHGDLPDDGVPIANSQLFLDALKANGVQGELHVDKGKPHGYGLDSDWPNDCIAFFERNGLLQKATVWTKALRPASSLLGSGSVESRAVFDLKGKRIVLTPMGNGTYRPGKSGPGLYLVKQGSVVGKIAMD